MFQEFKSEIKLLGMVVVAAIIIAAGGILLLKTIQPVSTVQQTRPPAPSPQPEPLDDSDFPLSDLSRAELSEVEGWQTYRNVGKEEESYRLVEIAFPKDWVVRTPSTPSKTFSQSLGLQSPVGAKEQFRASLAILNENEVGTYKISLEDGGFVRERLLDVMQRSWENFYTPVYLEYIQLTAMQAEFMFVPESGWHQITTDIRISPYVYRFTFVEMDPKDDKISAAARELNDQILSTFRFVDVDINEVEKQAYEEVPGGYNESRIHVKFKSGIDLSNPSAVLPQNILGDVEKIDYLFSRPEAQQDPVLGRWLDIRLKPGTNSVQYINTLILFEEVEYANFAPLPAPPGLVPPF